MTQDCPNCRKDHDRKALRELFTDLGYRVETDEELRKTLDLFWCDRRKDGGS